MITPARLLAMIALLVAALVAAAGASVASASPVASPPQGAVVASAPAQVRVVMDAPLEPDLVAARINGPRGAAQSGARVLPADPQAMRIAVPADGAGTYRVAWWGMTTDGRRTGGIPQPVTEACRHGHVSEQPVDRRIVEQRRQREPPLEFAEALEGKLGDRRTTLRELRREDLTTPVQPPTASTHRLAAAAPRWPQL